MTVGANAPGTVAQSQRRFWIALVATLGLAGVASVLFFDLGPSVPLNDDFNYAWSVSKLVHSHELRMFPEDSVLPFFQVVWAGLITLGHTGATTLRLSVFPMLVVAVVTCGLVARRLGAEPFWAVVAAAGLAAQPVFLSASTTFMTDTTFLALMLLSLWFSLDWLESGKRIVPTILFALLATLQHQSGAAFAAGMTCALLVAGRQRRVRSREWVFLVALWLILVAGVAVPELVGLANPVITARLSQTSVGDHLRALLILACMLMPVLGFGLLPMFGGVLATLRPNRPRLYLGIGLVLAPFLTMLLIFHRVSVFPNDYFRLAGLGPISLKGQKAELFPVPLFLGLMIAGAATGAALVVKHVGRGFLRPHDPLVLMALALAASQLLAPLLVASILDRYFLPATAILLAVVASRMPPVGNARFPKAWAVCSLALGVGIYVVGEQDYQAWQKARFDLAKAVYVSRSPSKVDAGYEMNGTYWVLPLYDATGTLPARGAGELSAALSGPNDPDVFLEFVGAPEHQSVHYDSLAPGWISVQQAPRR